MPYCIHCGVKLADRYTNCPLCTIPVEFSSTRKNFTPLYPNRVNKISIIKGQTNARDWVTIHFLGFVTFVSFLLTSGLDLYINLKLSWSLISSITLIFIYVSVTAILHLKRNPFLLYTYLNALLGLFLFSLDKIINNVSWFVQYALPCFVSLQLVSLTITILFRFIKSKLLRAATIIAITNFFLLVINKITVNTISWSIITTSVFIPTALFLFFLSIIIKPLNDYPSTI